MPDPRVVLHQTDRKSQESVTTEPATGVVPAPYYVELARQLVEANKDRYTDLLVYQLASAMNDEAGAVAAAYRMRCLVAVCLRLVERANIKPKGDEIAAMKLAEEVAFGNPARNGGNSWVDEDQLRIDLETYEEAA